MDNQNHYSWGIELICEQIYELKDLVEHLIDRISDRPDSPWLDLEQTAKYSNISTAHLRRLVSQSKLKASRIDPSKKRSKLIFFRPDIDQFLSCGHNRRLSKSEKTEHLRRMSALYNQFEERRN